MTRTPAYYAISFGAAAFVSLVLVASWIYLFSLHENEIASGLIHQVDRKQFVSKEIVDASGIAALALVALGVLVRTVRRSAPILAQESLAALRALPPKSPTSPSGGLRGILSRAGLWAVVRTTLRRMATGGMEECEDRVQGYAHLLVMWGFLGLFATTSLDALVNFDANVLPLLHPVRLLGNATGIVFMAGLTLALCRRALLASVRATSTAYDWTFLLSLWFTGATGFMVQWTADTGDVKGTAWTYGVHLILVALLLVSAPWSKFIHAVWRPTWILYSELTARKKP